MNFIVIQRTDKDQIDLYYGTFDTREEAQTFANNEESVIPSNQVCDVIPLLDPKLSRFIFKRK